MFIQKENRSCDCYVFVFESLRAMPFNSFLFALGAEDGFYVVFFDFDFADLFCFSDFGGLLHSRFAGGSIGRTRALT